MTLMKISEKGVALIKKFEGCKLYAYRDSVGIWTIGYGNTSHAKAGLAITQAQADKFLQEDVTPIEKALNAMNINFTQGQFDSLVSWCFNLGLGNFNSSTMKKRIVAKAGDTEITDEMIRWTRAGGKVLTGLVRRRAEEANMFLGRTVYYVNGLTIKKH